MVGVKVNTCLPFFLIDDLKTVVVDEHVCRTALQLVRGNCLLDGLDRRCDDRCQPFFVNGTLDSDVRQDAIRQPGRLDRRIELGVLVHLADWTDALSDATDDDLGEELFAFVSDGLEIGTLMKNLPR